MNLATLNNKLRETELWATLEEKSVYVRDTANKNFIAVYQVLLRAEPNSVTYEVVAEANNVKNLLEALSRAMGVRWMTKQGFDSDSYD
jgi:hypothetical protein